MSYGASFFKKSGDFKPLRKSIAKKHGKKKAEQIFNYAAAELDLIMSEFSDIPKGERNHTNNYIFPRVAVYRSLEKELGDNEAIRLIDEMIHIQGQKMGNTLRKFTALPFMEKLFLKIFTSMAKNMFGESNGFKQKFYSTQKGIVKFDILDCTYCRYCRLCNCPEIIHTFCNSDAYCFGNLSKINFTRQETLEYGEKCDFTLTITK